MLIGVHQVPTARERADDIAARYRRDGYAIVRGLFDPSEVEAIGEAVDQVHEEGVR